MKVLTIGAGNMGTTYALSISKSSVLNGQKVQIFDHNEDKIKKLKEEGSFDAFYNLKDCLPEADLIFIAVKPHQSAKLFRQMRPFINQTQLFISIMAGVSIKALQHGLQVQKVIRTMPNLPAQIGLGVTVFTPSKAVSNIELLLVKNLLMMTGKTVQVQNEDAIDAATAISGSGPAYVFYFMQALMEAAESLGLSDKEAHILVSSTFEGTINVFQRSNLSLTEWIKKVTSKGGTTSAAFDSFEKDKIKVAIKKGVFAAYERAKILGKN